jgi:hypothetical protein
LFLLPWRAKKIDFGIEISQQATPSRIDRLESAESCVCFGESKSRVGKINKRLWDGLALKVNFMRRPVVGEEKTSDLQMEEDMQRRCGEV